VKGRIYDVTRLNGKSWLQLFAHSEAADAIITVRAEDTADLLDAMRRAVSWICASNPSA
jgi:hypothetical protein